MVSGPTRTGSAAVAWATNQINHPLKDFYNLCLQVTRMAFGVGMNYPSAEKAWYGTKKRYGVKSTPPPGVPVWWTNGGNGHVAISVGNGYVVSNDFKRRGKMDKVAISAITKGWGLTYRGWTGDVNGVLVYSPPAPGSKPTPKPPVKATVMHASRLRECAAGNPVIRDDNPAYHEGYAFLRWMIRRHWLHEGGEETWARAIRQENDKAAGKYFTACVKLFQKRFGLLQDGIVGPKTQSVIVANSKGTFTFMGK